jgi:hypothetical protein
MIIARDMAGDISQQAADRVRPSQEQLSQVDQPAEENVWHEKPNIPKDQLKSRVQKSKVRPSSGSLCVRVLTSLIGRSW